METRDKGQITFYYNRQRRLEKASPSARFAFEQRTAKRPGIIRSLTATRSLRYLFFAMLFVLLAVMVVGYTRGERATGRIAGTNLTAKAMWFESQVYVTVKRSSPWYLGANPGPQSRTAIEIRSGDGSGHASAILQSVDDEVRLRFDAETKPARILVLASLPAVDGEEPEILRLVARVE